MGFLDITGVWTSAKDGLHEDPDPSDKVRRLSVLYRATDGLKCCCTSGKPVHQDNEVSNNWT